MTQTKLRKEQIPDDIDIAYFATYIDLNPIANGTKYPYSITSNGTKTFKRFSAGVVLVGGGHDASNYYTIEVYWRPTGVFGSDVLLTSFNTSAMTTNLSSYLLTTTTFSSPSKTGGMIYIQTVTTGTPSSMYLYSPELEFIKG